MPLLLTFLLKQPCFYFGYFETINLLIIKIEFNNREVAVDIFGYFL